MFILALTHNTAFPVFSTWFSTPIFWGRMSKPLWFSGVIPRSLFCCPNSSLVCLQGRCATRAGGSAQRSRPRRRVPCHGQTPPAQRNLREQVPQPHAAFRCRSHSRAVPRSRPRSPPSRSANAIAPRAGPAPAAPHGAAPRGRARRRLSAPLRRAPPAPPQRVPPRGPARLPLKFLPLAGRGRCAGSAGALPLGVYRGRPSRGRRSRIPGTNEAGEGAEEPPGGAPPFPTRPPRARAARGA